MSRSTCSHLSPSASPWRSPSASATTHRGTVAAVGHQRQQPPHLGDGVRLGFVVGELGRLGQQRRVLRDVPAAPGLVERVPDGAVHVMGGSRRAAAADHLGVELFEVLGFQLVEPVRADAGDEVNAHVYLVAGMRVLGDVRRGRDVLDPVG